MGSKHEARSVGSEEEELDDSEPDRDRVRYTDPDLNRRPEKASIVNRFWLRLFGPYL